ncbi:hypothetical protein T12_14237 [Trichinella patagoniensis]|uniref:Uncharacterized protein n=1 Tax=Trichinella patagoniensis TaxID=990121 RepID=A0A0V0ZWV9_9BILA|nr:hypothetical protein T12_14237 [Trichinella patagoniensis]
MIYVITTVSIIFNSGIPFLHPSSPNSGMYTCSRYFHLLITVESPPIVVHPQTTRPTIPSVCHTVSLPTKIYHSQSFSYYAIHHSVEDIRPNHTHLQWQFSVVYLLKTFPPYNQLGILAHSPLAVTETCEPHRQSFTNYSSSYTCHLPVHHLPIVVYAQTTLPTMHLYWYPRPVDPTLIINDVCSYQCFYYSLIAACAPRTPPAPLLGCIPAQYTSTT